MMHAPQDWFALFMEQFPFVSTSYFGSLVVFGPIIVMLAALCGIGVLAVLLLLLTPFSSLLGVKDIKSGWPRRSVATLLVLGFIGTLGAVLGALWFTLQHGSFLHTQSVAWGLLAGLFGLATAAVLAWEMYEKRHHPVDREVVPIDLLDFDSGTTSNAELYDEVDDDPGITRPLPAR